jgi:hypothetical protein
MKDMSTILSSAKVAWTSPLQFELRTFSVRTRSRGVSIEPDGARIVTRITKKRVSCDGLAQSRAWPSFGLEWPDVEFLGHTANFVVSRWNKSWRGHICGPWRSDWTAPAKKMARRPAYRPGSPCLCSLLISTGPEQVRAFCRQDCAAGATETQSAAAPQTHPPCPHPSGTRGAAALRGGQVSRVALSSRQ